MGYLSCTNSKSTSIANSQISHKLQKGPSKIIEFDFYTLHSATNGFSKSNLLGKGSHGCVYKAHLHTPNLTVAVKQTRHTTSIGANELDILSRIYHPLLVNLIGFANDAKNQHNKLIVVEYMDHGSLHSWLHASSRPPGWDQRIRFAIQVATAVQFLHSSNPPVIHRDIKSSNVLIDSRFNCRISDFGLSLRGDVEAIRVTETPPAGTLGYLDPCYLAPEDLSTKSDVFSFGILLLEIITGRNAIDVNYSPQWVMDWAVPQMTSGNIIGIFDPRIRAPEGGSAEALQRLAELAVRCVRSAADRRPGMEEVVECLKSMHRRMKMKRSCVGLWWRMGRVVVEPRVVKYEALDEVVRSRTSWRNGKVSSATSVQLGSDVIDYRVRRSKSIGTSGEIKFWPLDCSGDAISRRVGYGVKIPTVRLSRSRSTGILQAKRSFNGNGIDFAELENSKLLGRKL